MWTPCLSYVMQGIKPRVSCVPDKRLTNQTICTSCLVCLTSRKKSVNSTFLGTPRNSDFFAGLEEGDQGSGYEPYLKMIFAAAPTEAQVQLGLLILSDLETCFSLSPPRTHGGRHWGCHSWLPDLHKWHNAPTAAAGSLRDRLEGELREGGCMLGPLGPPISF